MSNRPGFCDGCHSCVEPCELAALKWKVRQLEADKLKWIEEVYWWKDKWAKEYWTARDYQYEIKLWLEKYK